MNEKGSITVNRESGEQTFFSYEDAALQPEDVLRGVPENVNPGKIVHLQAMQHKKVLQSLSSQERAGGEVVIDAANPKTPLEKLVQNRFVAGYRWKDKRRDHLYTIPLMAVGSRVAGRRLNNLFTAAQTRSLAPDIYLFRDKMNQGGIVIYYGEFASRRMAEEAARMISPLFDNAAFDVVQIRRAMQGVKR